MIAVSVIVPVYKVEKYLDRCLASLVNQTLDEIEIIVINDGSPDNSQVIIDRYVQNYPNRIFGYVKPNGGLSDARNFGIQFAKGTYIGFVDSDDYVELDMYEQMFKKALDDKADLVICDITYEWEKTKRTMLLKGLKDMDGLSENKRAFLSPLFAWNKLYHRRFFFEHKFRYPMNLWYEDIPVTLPIFTQASRITYIDEAFVHYIQRSNSIMGSGENPKQYDIFEIIESTLSYLKSNLLIKEYYEEFEYVCIEQLMLYGGFRFLKSKDYANLFDKSFKFMSMNFPNWKNNRYINSLPKKYQAYLKLISKQSIHIFRSLFKIKYR
ncbi:MAG TPA: glycosyl transferase family 2 [Erysipelotrichaceae bacterium]|nr:glycosyl transferase family 2 [Erysipelotrichaceae bacterium]